MVHKRNLGPTCMNDWLTSFNIFSWSICEIQFLLFTYFFLNLFSLLSNLKRTCFAIYGEYKYKYIYIYLEGSSPLLQAKPKPYKFCHYKYKLSEQSTNFLLSCFCLAFVHHQPWCSQGQLLSLISQCFQPLPLAMSGIHSLGI